MKEGLRGTGGVWAKEEHLTYFKYKFRIDNKEKMAESSPKLLKDIHLQIPWPSEFQG